MAKKIRFPLTMDNGVEVRSLKELKENFSLVSVLGYAKEGKLGIWLRDRYANDLADQIEALDRDDEQLAEKICRIFAVPYDASSFEAVEKIEERKRKKELLKQFPAARDYADRIDFIAFQQDDVYDLLDEGAEEIYLCGKEFSIPPSIEKVKFVGIIEDVVVCIEAQEPVDFGAKGIEFVNCSFDPEYQKIVSRASSRETTRSAIPAEVKGKVDWREVAFVVRDMTETVQEFRNAGLPKGRGKLYNSTDKLMFCEAGSYNRGGFASKAQARAACMQGLRKAIDDASAKYVKEKEKALTAAEAYYAPLKEQITDFVVTKFPEAFEAIVGSYCSAVATQDYLLSQFDQFKRDRAPEGWQQKIDAECRESFSVAEKELLENNLMHLSEAKKMLQVTPSLLDLGVIITTFPTTIAGSPSNMFTQVPLRSSRRLVDITEVLKAGAWFDECVYEQVEGGFSFNVGPACLGINQVLKHNIQYMESQFPEAVEKAYLAIKNTYADRLIAWLRELQGSSAVQDKSTGTGGTLSRPWDLVATPIWMKSK